MKANRRRARRIAVIAALAALGLFGLNHLMTFPMAFRAGDPDKWLGRGPAGKPLRRAYALVEMEPTQKDTPRTAAALKLLKKSEMAEDRSSYPASVSVGDFKYWESNRRVLLAPPPSTLSYRLTVPPRAVLDFGYALARYGKKIKNYPRRPATTFVISWQDQDGTRELFRQTVTLPPLGFWEQSRERARFYRMYLGVGLKRSEDMFREGRLDLSALAGRTGTLSFATLAAGDGGDFSLPALWAAPEIWAEREAADPAPVNVVLFMIEATTARIVSPYPGNPGITPNLAGFAREAAVFDRFFVVGSSTQLSVPPYFTGRHYKSLGLPTDVHFLASIVKERFYGHRFASLPEAFGRAGYATVEFGTNHYIQPTRDFGLDLGFDRIDILGRRYYAHVDTTLAAMEWLRQNGSKPFLLYVHYDSPHQEDKPCIEDLVRALPLRTGDDRWKFRKHLAQVMRADRDFGRLLDALAELGVRGRTLVVVTADHGNNLNPANSFTILVPGKEPWEIAFVHGQAMGVEDINVPLLVDWPIGPAGAIRTSAPLESIDLFPTLTQLVLKAPNPDTAARMRDLDGKSFAGIMDPTLPAFPGRPVTYAVSENGELIVANGRYHYSVRDQEHSRLLFPGRDQVQIVRERLYDLDRDPMEASDLAQSRPDLLAQMRQLLSANRPPEPVMSVLYLNYKGGHVRGLLGIERKSGRAAATTFPDSRPPIGLRPLVDAPTGAVAVVSFETDLAGPTGLMLEDTVKWAWVQHGDTVVGSGDYRLGPFGLPLLASGGAHTTALPLLPDSRQLQPTGFESIDPALLLSSVHPAFYSAGEGVYFYQMTFADLIARDFSDKALSSGVRSILKEWGYIR